MSAATYPPKRREVRPRECSGDHMPSENHSKIAKVSRAAIYRIVRGAKMVNPADPILSLSHRPGQLQIKKHRHSRVPSGSQEVQGGCERLGIRSHSPQRLAPIRSRRQFRGRITDAAILERRVKELNYSVDDDESFVVDQSADSVDAIDRGGGPTVAGRGGNKQGLAGE